MEDQCKIFRLYPERYDKRWYKVFVFQTKKLMYGFWNAQHALDRIEYRLGYEASVANDFAAITSGWASYSVKRDGTETQHNDVGQILFHEGRMGSGIVSHEMTHAALMWLWRLGFAYKDLDDQQIEERLCLAAGNLNRQFWLKYQKASHGDK